MSTPPPKIVVTGRIPHPGSTLLREAGERLRSGTTTTRSPSTSATEQLADADAAVTLLSDRVDDGFLAAAPNLGIVANVAVGYNNIDVEACTARDVRVTNTPGVLTDATADLTIALLLAVTRRIGEGERLIRLGDTRGNGACS